MKNTVLALKAGAVAPTPRMRGYAATKGNPRSGISFRFFESVPAPLYRGLALMREDFLNHQLPFFYGSDVNSCS